MTTMQESDAQTFTILGQTVREAQSTLETFATPRAVSEVKLVCDEVTSLCPVTGQPDMETVTFTYAPDARCIESKSLKLFLWQFRERGVFCEQFAHDLAHAVMEAAAPFWVRVEVAQKSRGGIAITASAQCVRVSGLGKTEILEGERDLRAALEEYQHTN